MIYDLSHWPEVDMAQVRAAFPEIPLSAYPSLAGYNRASIHEGLAGQGGLFLASDMARFLRLQPGLRVLDLGCGSGVTSVYLAKAFGVNVQAVDQAPSELLFQRIARAGVGQLVTVVQSDARQLPF